MVAECEANSRLIKGVAEIYKRLDSQIRESVHLAGICGTCGKCCDFAQLDHRLFVTTPELIYLAANLDAENVKPMTTGRCPYNIRGKCSVYEHRFSGCRIFSCKGDADFQSRLSESAVKKFKAICEQFQIPYRYTDLATALNDFTVA
jgi:Fe-S-cluster containining protein